jgi:hypothetical protein
MQLGMNSLKDTIRTPLSFLKPWPIKRHGFSMFFLGCQIPTITSMSFKKVTTLCKASNGRDVIGGIRGHRPDL